MREGRPLTDVVAGIMNGDPLELQPDKGRSLNVVLGEILGCTDFVERVNVEDRVGEDELVSGGSMVERIQKKLESSQS